MQYIQSNTSTQTVNISSLRRSVAVLPTCHSTVLFTASSKHPGLGIWEKSNKRRKPDLISESVS